MMQRYRERLLAGRDACVLFDTPMLVRRLEELYRHIWAEYQDGHLPRPDLANLEMYLEVGVEQDHDAVEVLAIGDYAAWWLAQLARRHAFRPIAPDRRLWTEAVAMSARL